MSGRWERGQVNYRNLAVSSFLGSCCWAGGSYSVNNHSLTLTTVFRACFSPPVSVSFPALVNSPTHNLVTERWLSGRKRGIANVENPTATSRVFPNNYATSNDLHVYHVLHDEARSCTVGNIWRNKPVTLLRLQSAARAKMLKSSHYTGPALQSGVTGTKAPDPHEFVSPLDGRHN